MGTIYLLNTQISTNKKATILYNKTHEMVYEE